MLNIITSILIFSASILLFLLMVKVYQKYPLPFLLPILTVTIIIGAILVLGNISYDTYMLGGIWIQKFLGPAVVALAVPLYKQRKLMFQYKISILISIIVAMISGLISVFMLLILFGASKAFILTALPKSITTPVAMDVSSAIGGIPPLTAVLVMIAGFTGAIFGPPLIKLFKIESAISRGVSMGSVSHGVGVSKLKEYGEETLSIGSVAMSLSAVIGAVICPIFALIIF